MPFSASNIKIIKIPFTLRIGCVIYCRRDYCIDGQGFTLVELLIAVSIIGILTALAFPQYLQARAAARIGSRIGEAIAAARECQAYVGSGIGSPPGRPAPDPAQGGVSIDKCDLNDGIEITASWAASDRAANISCLSARSDLDSASATLEAPANGALTCRFN